MAELIHTFTSGKMNKDLDERLVPNGEYRDALNLELASSDSSQVGTFQNIKGNLELAYKTYNPITEARTVWTSNYISDLTNASCVGTVTDRNTDNIYWFIESDEVSAIAYYNDVTKVIAPLIVDANNILNFSKDYLITGVNVLEGILMWTDNQTEPKSVTIKDWIGSTVDFLTHSQIYGRDFIEQDITVIKKYPLQPPTITASSTTRVDNNGNPATIETKVNFSFVKNIGTDPANPIYVGLTPEDGPQTMTWIQQQNPPFYQPGDYLVFSFAGNEPLSEDANIRAQVVSVIPSTPNATQTGAIVTILSVGEGDENNDEAIKEFEVVLEQEDPFFEFRFARFGYRYKYNNNQISAFSPFSNPAFLPGEFEYNPKNGYNLGMVNTIRQLEISNFRPTDIPPDVDTIDILYKATNNPNVYVVDSFTPEDTEWEANNFNIKTEIITSVVKSNQILRPYDNVPRKAKAQEITANRLIYGNYTQNFNLDNPYAKNAPLHVALSVGTDVREVSSDASLAGGASINGLNVAESVKSIRTYQAGVAYMDEYGRTTPVFTSALGAIIIPKNQASFSTKLTVKIDSALPYYDTGKPFTHFKYYVKETSQPYYNLCLDRFYNAEDGNLWLSFPSSERNKVDEETFLILKKEHDNATPVKDTAAKYKVLAISNEAPQFLKDTRLSKGSAPLIPTGSATPTVGSNEFFISGEDFDDAFGAETRTISGLVLRISAPGNNSDYYKISTFGLADVPNPPVRIVVSEVFGDDMAFASDPNTGLPVGGLLLNLYEIVTENKPEFTGRFFVKVNKDAILTEKIAAAAAADPIYVRKAFEFLYQAQFNQGSKGFWNETWRNPDGQGNGPKGRLFINYIETDCEGPFNGVDDTGTMRLADATGYGEHRQTGGIAERNPAMLRQLNIGSGARFRFVEAPGSTITGIPDTVYRITQSTNEERRNTWWCGDNAKNKRKHMSNQITYWTLKFQRVEDGVAALDWKPKEDGGMSNWSGSTTNWGNSFIGIEFIDTIEDNNSFTTDNPAIFETEPKEAAELDIYWEVPGSYTAAQHGQTHALDWFNCYSFGNGVESDRIRDDFNQPLIENGVKASATLEEPYGEEHRSTGLIFSQIFNSTSSTNNLNQFIQAESITKDVNPEYGSIQKLHTRDTDLITLCENKSMKILAKKDALFNADGSTNLTSNAAVLGQTITFQGEFGIATNPESFAEFGFRMYYTDANKGAVLRLSGDGITDVSDYGMHSFFSDNLPVNTKILGSWDVGKRNYNITLKSLTPYWQQTLGAGEFDRINRDPACNQFINTLPTYNTTISFKEQVNGFTSRKVYIPEAAAYLNNIYYTFKNGRIWEHGLNTAYNTFYGIGPDNAFVGPYYESSFNTILNENPAVVKGYKTLNYSGTDAKEFLYKLTGSERLYTLAQIQAKNLTPASSQETKGWYVNSIVTDLQEGQIREFLDKEGKKFNYIKGMDTFYLSSCNTNVDTKEFNVQGIGNPSVITVPPQTVFTVRNQADPNCSTP